MKILISTLILNIAVFLQFGELKAAENQGSSSAAGGQHGGARRGAGRPRGRASRRQDGIIQGEFRIKPYYRQPVVVKEESDGFIEHRGQRIEVWLNDSKTKVLKAEYPGHKVPSGQDYVLKTFLVRLATLERGLEIVEYVKQDGNLMAVRAPIPTNANVMEPSSTQWFIVYEGKYFRVRINPTTKAVKSITIASKSEHEVAQGRVAEEVNMAGFKFVLIREPTHSEITGAVTLGALLHL